jgi:hypothetical protein
VFGQSLGSAHLAGWPNKQAWAVVICLTARLPEGLCGLQVGSPGPVPEVHIGAGGQQLSREGRWCLLLASCPHPQEEAGRQQAGRELGGQSQLRGRAGLGLSRFEQDAGSMARKGTEPISK